MASSLRLKPRWMIRLNSLVLPVCFHICLSVMGLFSQFGPKDAVAPSPDYQLACHWQKPLLVLGQCTFCLSFVWLSNWARMYWLYFILTSAIKEICSGSVYRNTLMVVLIVGGNRDRIVLKLLLLSCSRGTIGSFSVCPVVCLFPNLCGKYGKEGRELCCYQYPVQIPDADGRRVHTCAWLKVEICTLVASNDAQLGPN